MSRTSTYRTTRFRRWSRASYAIFASLHKEVSIGRVSKDIADASLAKCGGTVSVHRRGRTATCAYTDREPEMHVIPCMELCAGLCTALSADNRNSVAVPEHTDDDIYKHTGRGRHHVFSPTVSFYTT